MTRNHGQNC